MLCFALVACHSRQHGQTPDDGPSGPLMLEDAGVDMVQTDANGCGTQKLVPLEPGQPVDIMIILDRSGSMLDDPQGQSLPDPTPNPASKWVQVTTAIKEEVKSVSTIDWGLWMFSTGLCDVNPDPDVILGSASSSITAKLNDTFPTGGTPTTAAITQATHYLQAYPNAHKRFFLLATDGQPNCNPNGPPDDSQNAIAAVQAAHDAGFHTFVIGVGSTPDADATLTQMALAGGEPNRDPQSHSYYTVSSTNDFVTVLEDIAATIVSCTYPLGDQRTDYLTVTANGLEIPRDTTHTNGWDYNDTKDSIIFYGLTCREVQVGALNHLRAEFACYPIN